MDAVDPEVNVAFGRQRVCSSDQASLSRPMVEAESPPAARCSTATIGGDSTDTMEQSQVGLFLRRAPSVPIPGAEDCGLAHNIERANASR
jgi:hypothetical protein